MKRPLIAIFCLLLALPLSFALTSYNNTGGADSQFLLATNIFNDQLETFDTFTRSVTNPKFTPLVADLDQDGDNEIIVLEGGSTRQLKIFDSSLNILNSIALGTSSFFSPPIIYNMMDTPVSAPTLQTITIVPHTTHVAEATPTTAFGTASSNNVDRQGGDKQNLLLFNDLSSIPEGSQIVSAVVRMTLTGGSGASPVSITAHALNESYIETLVTWNTRVGSTAWNTLGGSFDPAIEATQSVTNTIGASYAWNITSLVSSYVAGSRVNNGVLLQTSGGGGDSLKQFTSDDNTNPANITISYIPPATIMGDLPEIVVADQKAIYMVNYNGSGFINRSHLISGGTSFSEMVVACRAKEQCGIIFTGTNAQFATFNSSGIISTINIDTTANTDKCFPHILTMPTADVDANGLKEYVMTIIRQTDTAGSSESASIYYIEPSENNSVVSGNVRSVALPSLGNIVTASASTTGCNTEDSANGQPAGKFISSPLIFDIDGSSGNGLETIVAHAIDEDEFVMRSYLATGSQLDRYPEVLNADGRIISNPMRINAFHDTGADDFCVLGFKTDANRIDLLCGSELTSLTPQTEEFIFDTEGRSNVSAVYQSASALIHAVQSSTITTEGNNLNELLHYYGVSRLNWDTGIFPPDNELELIWEVPQVGGLFAVDRDDVGIEDIISLTPTNIWLFDDGFTNTNAQISSYDINPCLDSTWKRGTNVNVRLNLNDENGDDVSARVKLYEGALNELDSEWSINASDSTTFSFSFTANDTTPISTLSMFGRDIKHPSIDDADRIDVTFSVGENGVEFGDCTTSVAIDLDEGAGTGGNFTDDGTDIDNNAISTGVDEVGELFGFGRTIVWLIIMFVVSMAILWEGRETFRGQPSALFGIIVLVETLLLIIGTYLGFLGLGVLITIVVMGIIAVGLYLNSLRRVGV